MAAIWRISLIVISLGRQSRIENVMFGNLCPLNDDRGDGSLPGI